ncbi:MAG: ATP-grasp domain-containing protein [Micrococcales bacterium]|nr:ATP-grasp domain-containing protein [Micrococcales bacterium]
MPFTTVLIANRAEIAVRIARACRDAGLRSVAVYAEPDRDALHVRLADQAFSLGGTRPADTYLDMAKLLDVAHRSGADAVHPGYGFLAENATFAQAVIDAGLVWIGPPPEAIQALGDKVSARHIAARAGAPLVPGTPDPVDDAAQIHQFAAQHGLPVAIKAAFGGGGRGLKVARTFAEIDEAYASAVREATVAFGRGECFVERYLDRPRHVETQCLADAHNNVVVVSTRDCSLQRRHQKLVEEAPAPFLSPHQEQTLVDASVAVLREAGYVGAGTCEFLLGADGSVAFLEVNTRLQVEHPVSEEVTGLDLVREQFRIAAGEPLGYDHVTTRGHSIELRINGEDPAAGFLPAPGTITTLRLPAGPGVRVDSGVVEGDRVEPAFDSLLLKLIVTGADRAQAVARARRALDELVVEGVATVAPFHRAVLADPAFVPPDTAAFTVHTRWIETEFADRLAGLTPATTSDPGDQAAEPELERVVVEVAGKRLEVVLPVALASRPGPRPRPPIRRPAPRAAAGGHALTSPMQGTIVTVAVAEGDQVAVGDLVVVLEAMKMEQPLVAHRPGTICGLSAQPGSAVSAGSIICQIGD